MRDGFRTLPDRNPSHKGDCSLKIYTKTGDAGETGLLGGIRLRKDAPRIEAYGTIDELNASLGVARSSRLPGAIDDIVEGIQHELFAMGAELASPKAAGDGTLGVDAAAVQRLERAIDEAEAGLAPLKQFILPGGSPSAAQLHLARTVCRRAERRVISLSTLPNEAVGQHTVVYLNRLGDLLFVLARLANALAKSTLR